MNDHFIGSSIDDSATISLNGNQNCKSCGLPFTDHLGIIGTCAEKIANKRKIDLISKAMERWHKFKSGQAEGNLGDILREIEEALK